MSLKSRLERLERETVPGLEAAREAEEAEERRREYWRDFYSPERVEARDAERRQGDRDLLESNRASVGLAPLTAEEIRRYELEGTRFTFL